MAPTADDTDNNAAAPLTRQRVVDAAMALADQIGLQPFTIRRLAAALDTKPMTIYHHINGKEAILDAMVDAVFGQIALPQPDLAWKPAMRRRCVSARGVLARHSWAIPLLESRTSPGQATLRHHDAVIGCLRNGGLSIALTAHAYAILDSFVYGFALQEAALPFAATSDMTEVVGAILGTMQGFPNLAELTTQHVLQPGYDFGASFEVGLDLLLDGIEAAAGR